MTRVRRLVRSLARVDGAEIAEAALVLPLVFMLLLGIVWFGRAFNIYSTIQQAAQQGAIFAARGTCATCGNDFPTNFEVRKAVDAVMQASNLDPNQIKSSPNPNLLRCPAALASDGCVEVSKIWVCRNVELNPAAGPPLQTPQCGSVVRFQYPFQFYLPFTSLNNQQVTLTGNAASRMEN